MAMDPTLAAALEAQGLRAVTAIKLELVDGTVRLFDGRGNVTLNGETYVGVDDLFGSMDVMDAVSESIANEAPTVSVTMMIPNETGMISLLKPANQNKSVKVLFAVIDYDTGAAIGQPELLWSGRVDTSKIISGENRQTVEVVTVSAFDRLFAGDEAQRLNSTWHQRIWPNETGFDRVIAGLADPYWGNKEATGSSSGSGGGAFEPWRLRQVDK